MAQSLSFCFTLVLVRSLYFAYAIPKSNFTDQSALLAIKSHLHFEPFLANNWTTTTSFCHWLGVTCSARHNRVAALNLSNTNLKGNLPPHVGNLTFLVSIDLSNNSLEGSLPEELGHLHHLRYMNLGINNFTGELPPKLFQPLSKLQHLILPNNSLTGALPTSLFNLTSLTTLDFLGNLLHGSIQKEIGYLSNLETLRMRGNQISGAIPYSIFNLSSIRYIDLSRNKLSGSLNNQEELCDPEATKLEYLNLGDNMLHGPIPDSLYKCRELHVLGLFSNRFTYLPRGIGNLTKLERAILGTNNLTGEFPQDIGYLVNLQKLGLEDNQLHGSIPENIGNCTSLFGVALGPNNFTGPLPSSIGQLSNLQEIFLFNNQMSGQIPDTICNASKLVTLDVSVNAFSGYVPDSLGNLRDLKYFVITGNLLTSKPSLEETNFISSLSHCKHLKYLWLDQNPLNVVLPKSIGNLSALQDLSAAYSGIQGSIPAEIGNLSSLIGLTLIGNAVNGTIPRAVGRLLNLQSILLTSNQLHGPIPYEVCSLESLVYLYLDDNKLSGSLPACLSNLKSLQQFVLAANNFIGTIPPAYWSLKDILYVNLSFNSLGGSLPMEIGNVKVISQMDLSSNQLSGDIPTSIGDLQDLEFLSLSGNRFQGRIPESIGKLINLEFLNLSSNRLSGEIPKSLEKLLHLGQLNLSFNQLQGEIPDGGPFANFTAQSFMGNHELCGPSWLQVPRCKGARKTSNMSRIHMIFIVIFPTIASIILIIAFTIVFLRSRKRGVKPQTQGEFLPLPALPRISYHEIDRATNGFHQSNLLGTGSFGSVYKGTLSEGKAIAVKVFNLQQERAFESFDTECEVLRNLRHRNLIRIISSCSNLDFRALVLEFMPNWSLEQWLHSDDYFLDALQRLNIMIDVASALEYLHHGYSIPVVHCDLKPSNVLLDEDMVAHVADFGIAKLLGDGESMTQTLTLATIGYMPPEYGSEGIVSTRGDVYSYGVLLMETFTGKKPTDEMFAEGTSMKQWLKQSLPVSIADVVDVNLLHKRDEHLVTKEKECLTEILELGVVCTADLPQDRMKMKDIVSALEKIKTKLSKHGGLARRPQVISL